MPTHAKLIPCKISAKDAHHGRVRLTWTCSATDTEAVRAAGDGFALSEEAAAAFPLAGQWRYILLGGFTEGQIPLVSQVAPAVAAFLAQCKKCSCGKPCQRGLRACSTCLKPLFEEAQRRANPESDAPVSGPKIRTRDHKENTWETKHGG